MPVEGTIDEEVNGSMIAPVDGVINEEVDEGMLAPITDGAIDEDAAIDKVNIGANVDV